MSKGGESGGSQEVKITPEEIEQIKIAEEQWARYEKVGIPLSNEYIQRATGYSVNENGELEVADRERNILNKDGTVKTDASGAIAGTEKAYAQGLKKINPNSGNYRSGVADIEAEKMKTGSEAEGGVQLGQQNRYLKGLENVSAMGRGEQVNAVNGLMDLTENAANKANRDAELAYRKSKERKQFAGQVIGMGASLALGGLQKTGGQGLGSLGRNTTRGGLFKMGNGLKTSTGGRYYDRDQDFYA